MTFADELKKFNQARKEQFGRWPTPDDPLPMAPTGRGGDLPRERDDERNNRT